MTGLLAGRLRSARSRSRAAVALGVFLSASAAQPVTGVRADPAHTAPMAAAPAAAQAATGETAIEIRRTGDGVPHIRASNWRDLGYGYGYAQAQDNLCTMAEAFLTYRGERSRYFGPDRRPGWHSTVGEPSNLDSDLFFRLIETPRKLQAYRVAQSQEMDSLIDGFARGYNAYLGQWRGDPASRAHAACSTAPWVGEISTGDIYRRLYAANLAGGYLGFVPGIAAASPVAHAADDMKKPVATPAGSRPVDPRAADDVGRQVATAWFQAGRAVGIGSNGIAFGADATGTDSGLLLGNPHWYWTGPDRFYQAQLTIPGRIDVAGVSFLGVPVIMLGFNRNVAWTHTVSAARRFGLYELRLVPGQPTRYLVDGQVVAMDPVELKVPVLEPDGTINEVSRTLYMTRYGPLVDLAGFSPALRTTPERAFAIRDVNADNFRIFQNFLEWGQAGSLDAFVSIQKRLAAMPWVNTLAVGKGDGRAWYADIGNVPNVSDAFAAACVTPLGRAFRQGAPGVPFLDGSRSACDWPNAAGAEQAGSMAAGGMPALPRRDYVANMNNSYWLANPARPLEGFPEVLGGERKELTLRQRQGYWLIARALQGKDGRDGARLTPESLRSLSLDAYAMSAVLFRQDVVQAACGKGTVRVVRDVLSGQAFDPPRDVSLEDACRVLRRWDGRGREDSAGAPLWDEFWNRVAKLDASALYERPFDPAQPLDTPGGMNAGREDVAQALGAAVLSLRARHLSPAATRRETLSVDIGNTHVALFGGCDRPGYFTAACPFWGSGSAGPIPLSDLQGNTYMQVVTFDAHGPRAWSMLAHGESDDPSNASFGQGTRRYALRSWTPWRFEESDIHADPDLLVRVLHQKSSAPPRSDLPGSAIPALQDRWDVVDSFVKDSCDAACRTEPVAARWRTVHAAHPGVNARDAARALGVAEVELIAGEIGDDVVPLRTDEASLERIWSRLEALGPVIAVSRNENGISERTVVVAKPKPFDPMAARENGGSLLQSMHWRAWRYLLAVTHYAPGTHKPVRSLQAYDAHGDSITKIILDTPDGDVAFHRIAMDYRQPGSYTPPVPAAHDRQCGTDVVAGMPPLFSGVHDRAAVARAFEQLAGAPPSLETVGDAAVRHVGAATFADFATRLIERGVPVSIAVDNRGLTQTYVGVIDTARSIGMGYFSLAASGFELHVYLPSIQGGDVYRIDDGRITVVEFYDRSGCAVARFMDGAGEGAVDSVSWREQAGSLTSKK